MNEPDATAGRDSVRVTCDALRSFYANAFNVSGAPGEIAILFGTNPGPGPDGTVVRFSDCAVLSATTARQLASALSRAVQEHDRRHAAAQAQAAGGAEGVGSMAALAGQAPPGAGDQADLIVALVDALGVPYGFERSFRLSPSSLQAGRFLLSLHRDALGEQARARVREVCGRLGMPEEFLAGVAEHFDEADIVHLGFEGHGGRCLYKLYLERGRALRQEAAPAPGEGRLLHWAYKWDPQRPESRFLTKYVWYPDLSAAQIEARVGAIFAGAEHAEPLAILRGLLEIAARRIRPEAMLYLEALEERTPRRSFDINLYEARLELGPLYPLLSRMCRHWGVPYEEFAALYEPAKDKSFGHLSGGIHRGGEGFFSVYYGVEGRGE
ncbi:MAG: hypothetical protein NTV86_12435 [Planctomycetota bacterium]|nr:hypothetical protein [Planctomycetota bacterium]